MHTFYLRKEANALKAALDFFFFLISYCFHRFYCNQVTVNLDPTVALV